MFAKNTLVALLAFAVPFIVHADVNPTIPAPGAVYNEGSSCLVGWAGDTNSTTIWKNMTIQLMAGSNLDMQVLTTVAVGQDGTTTGQFTYPCPQVTPNSAIYFYQFSSAQTNVLAWTGRFAIATASGQTTPPPNATQPDGSPIPWGNAVLGNAPSASSSPSSASSTASSVLSSSTSSSNTTFPSSATTTPSALSFSTPSASSSTQPLTSGASDAMVAFDIRVLGATAVATLALSLVW